MTGSGGFRSGGMRRITPNCLSSLVQLRNQQRSPSAAAPTLMPGRHFF